MVLPNLLHPVNITIHQIVTADTIYDEDTREPIQHAARATATVVPGQVRWGAEQNYLQSEAGPQEQSDGYVLFRYVDLDAKGVTIRREDRLSFLGNRSADVYIVKLKPMGHYTDREGPTLVKAYFQDRQPNKLP